MVTLYCLAYASAYALSAKDNLNLFACALHSGRASELTPKHTMKKLSVTALAKPAPLIQVLDRRPVPTANDRWTCGFVDREGR